MPQVHARAEIGQILLQSSPAMPSMVCSLRAIAAQPTSELHVTVGAEDVGRVQDAELPSMAAALQQAGLQSAAKKLGEGTYGEAFRISTSVVKILPFAPMPGTKDGEDSMLSAADILAEAAIMQELNALRQGLIPLSKHAQQAALTRVTAIPCLTWSQGHRLSRNRPCWMSPSNPASFTFWVIGNHSSSPHMSLQAFGDRSQPHH